MAGIKADFVLEKATKNTYRYSEVEIPRTLPVMRALYIQKSVLDIPPPEKITVSINWEEEK